MVHIKSHVKSNLSTKKSSKIEIHVILLKKERTKKQGPCFTCISIGVGRGGGGNNFGGGRGQHTLWFGTDWGRGGASISLQPAKRLAPLAPPPPNILNLGPQYSKPSYAYDFCLEITSDVCCSNFKVILQ